MDDGYCSTLVSEEECVEQKSMFDNTQATCGWQEEEVACVYREVVLTVRVRFN
jgi:hypothetical protein